jgi:3-hydroxybutyryl-CoA dehydrogenase
MALKVADIKKLAVVGVGLMGHGIAQSYAQYGYPVTITDADKQARAGVKNRMKANLETLAAGGIFPRSEVTAILDRVTVVDTPDKAVRDAHFVTEAIFEDLEAKKVVFRDMEKSCSPETILASNTSSFPMTEISSLMQRPERAIVTHWSNPPYFVPLVEVVPGKKTSEDTTRTAYHLLLRVKKVPVRLKKEIIGFILNRVQVAMNREVYYLVEQGVVSPEDMDKAMMTSLGFRLPFQGPLQVRDLAGLAVTLKVDEILLPEISSSTKPSKLLQVMVARGEGGAKTGKGFFEYTPETLAKVIRERDRHFIMLLKELYLK